MKNLNMAEIAARYNFTPRAMERLLERAGWIVNGVFTERPFKRGYIENDKVTPRGQVYLDEVNREKSR